MVLSMVLVDSECLVLVTLAFLVLTIGQRGVFTDTSDDLVLYYHYADTDDGLADADYLFGWNTLTWSDGWPSV